MGLLWNIVVKVEQVHDYVVDCLMYALNHFVGMETQIKYLPQLSLNFIGKYTALSYLGRGLPPQFNKILEVPGLPSGSVRWFAKPTLRQHDDPVVLMLHGGGYAIGLLPSHGLQLKETWDLVGNDRLSIVWLDYTLSGKARFPKQLDEALAVYRELLKESSNITLIGDSAGGHLSLSLTRELHKLGLPKPSNVVLISPWTNILPEIKGSYEDFKKKDRLHPAGAQVFGRMVLPLDAEEASKVVDLSTDPNWHEYLPAYDHVLVAYGEVEILRDDIENFIAKTGLDKGASIAIEPNGKHDSPVMVGCGPFRAQPNHIVQSVAEFLRKQTV